MPTKLEKTARNIAKLEVKAILYRAAGIKLIKETDSITVDMCHVKNGKQVRSAIYTLAELIERRMRKHGGRILKAARKKLREGRK